jgi:hypothetical protein
MMKASLLMLSVRSKVEAVHAGICTTGRECSLACALGKHGTSYTPHTQQSDRRDLAEILFHGYPHSWMSTKERARESAYRAERRDLHRYLRLLDQRGTIMGEAIRWL